MTKGAQTVGKKVVQETVKKVVPQQLPKSSFKAFSKTATEFAEGIAKKQAANAAKLIKAKEGLTQMKKLVRMGMMDKSKLTEQLSYIKSLENLSSNLKFKSGGVNNVYNVYGAAGENIDYCRKFNKSNKKSLFGASENICKNRPLK